MRMRVAGFGALMCGVLTLAATGGARAQAQDANQQGPIPQINLAGGESNIDPNQPVRVGFTLSVRVESAAGNEPDLTGTYKVDPTGSIVIKLAGPVPVKGLTPLQAADKIAIALKPYIKDPKVTVTIADVPKPVVLITGAVPRGGAVPVSDTTTLAELVSAVTYTENADLTRVFVTHRDEKGNRVTKEYNLLRWLHPNPGEAPDENQNPVLTDRDFVYIPPKIVTGSGVVTVEGQVTRPGVVPTRAGVPLTLREAISLAGGPTPVAERRKITVRRLNQPSAMFIDYDQMEAGVPTQNIVVQPEDIVYVETLGVDQFVNMNGPFVRPGKLPYTREMTLTQAIGEAAGIQLTAREKNGHVFRHPVSGDPTATQVIAFNYDAIRNNKQPDIRLEPGDTVEVPFGLGPRPALTPLELTQSLLSIALIVDRIYSGRTTGF